MNIENGRSVYDIIRCMDDSTGERGEGYSPQERKASFPEILKENVLPAIGPYKAVLTSEAEDLRYSELGNYSKQMLDRHLSQLDILSEMLLDAIDQKPFTTVVQTHKIFEDRERPRETFSLRIAPRGEDIPFEPRIQNQLSLHVNVASRGESQTDAIYALGLKGREPEKVLKQYFEQTTEQVVSINTVGVYKEELSRDIRVNPQAGITFRWRTGEEEVMVGGIVFVSNRQHVMELPVQRIPKDRFVSLQRDIMKAVGRTSQRRVR